MNNFRKHILLLLLLIVTTTDKLFAIPRQSVEITVQLFKSSVSSRNTEFLSEILDNNIDITYNNVHSTYAKSQALMIINDFYSKNKPSVFRLSYKGSYPNIEDQYVIGTISSATSDFKVYMYIKNRGGKFVIQELKIVND